MNQNEPESHIIGISENLSMTTSGLRSLIELGISGRLDSVESKIDGQNFTVTYDGKNLRLLGKGVSAKRLTEGGFQLQDAVLKFPEHLRDDIQCAMQDTEAWISTLDSSLVSRAFAGGKIAIECSLVSRDNPITIRYGVNQVRTLRFCSPLGHTVDQDAAAEILGSSYAGERFKILPCEKPRIKTSSMLFDFKSGAITLGEIARQECERVALEQGIRKDFAKIISERLVLDAHDHTAIKRADRSGRLWDVIKALESDGNLRLSSLIPVEKTVQSLTNLVISCYEFDLVAQKEMHEKLMKEMRDIVDAFKSGDIAMMKDGRKMKLNDFWRERMRISIDRLGGSFDLLPVEGIVFRYGDKRMKMTGMYTSCHKLMAPFKFETKGEKLVLLKS